MRLLKKISFAVFYAFIVVPAVAQDNKLPLFKIGIVADVQYADRDSLGTRYYRLSSEKLEEAVDTFNGQKVDFVCSLGDFINDGYQNFKPLLKITDKLQMPLYHVLGNHDFVVDPKNKKEQLYDLLNMPGPYYSFEKEGWKIIVLDGNDISLYANAKDSKKYKQAKHIHEKLMAEGAENSHHWNGAVGPEQMKWLKRELSLSQKKNEKVILMCHFPICPDGWGYTLWNAPKVRKLIEKYPNVFAWFNGHVHSSHFSKNNGISYVTFRGMVEKEENSFAIVSVYTDSLKITGYRKEISRILH